MFDAVTSSVWFSLWFLVGVIPMAEVLGFGGWSQVTSTAEVFGFGGPCGAGCSHGDALPAARGQICLTPTAGKMIHRIIFLRPFKSPKEQ